MVITVTTEGFERVFAVTDRLANPQWDQLLNLIGLTVEEQAVNHFQDQAGPEGPWAPLARPRRLPGAAGVDAVLVFTGRLRGSIEYQVTPPDTVEIGTNVVYAKFHQQSEGTGTGRIPRRMFLGLTENDKVELTQVIEDYIARLISAA